MDYYLGYLKEDLRLTKEYLEAWKQDKSRTSVLVETALAGDNESHDRHQQQAFLIRCNSIPMDCEVQQDLDTSLEESFYEANARVGKSGPRKITKRARDYEIAFKIQEKIDQGLTLERASNEVYDECLELVKFQRRDKIYLAISPQRIRQIYRKYKNYIEEYMRVLQQREAEYRDRMDKTLDREMRILYPEAVNEALDLIEDEAVVALPETSKRLKELEKATKLEEERFMTVYATRNLHKMYWHGLKGQTAFYPPLWDRYFSALKRVVELNQTGRSNG